MYDIHHLSLTPPPIAAGKEIPIHGHCFDKHKRSDHEYNYAQSKAVNIKIM